MSVRSNDNASEPNAAGTACEQDPVSAADRDPLNSNETQHSEKKQSVDESVPSIDDMITSAKWVILQKQQELMALGDLTASEVEIAKRSIVVTGIATLAAFVFACFCWLITNIGIGLVLHNLNLSHGYIALIVFAINITLATVAFLIAKQSYGYITLMPALRTLLQGVGMRKTPAEKE